ncbi:MAG: hypothetical protein IJL52_05060 [Clostridia bacterium]|nr:hypothetical protein [Clostridia bacterium]
MSINLTALFMVIYLFFSGLFYGNQPVKLEVQHCSLDDGAIVFDRADAQERADQYGGDLNEVSLTLPLRITYKNVGRPFQLTSDLHSQVTVYQMIDGEKRIMPPKWEYPDLDMGPVLIRHNAVFTMDDSTPVLEGLPIGSYNVEVYTPDGQTLVYEDILIIK